MARKDGDRFTPPNDFPVARLSPVMSGHRLQYAGILQFWKDALHVAGLLNEPAFRSGHTGPGSPQVSFPFAETGLKYHPAGHRHRKIRVKLFPEAVEEDSIEIGRAHV